jgi:GNAT superfamily N-acetyltransferase
MEPTRRAGQTSSERAPASSFIMGTRIEVGDPVQYAGVASHILQAAWKPPCLHYPADYLAWQFSFPGDIRKSAAVAFLDDRPVGFIAVTARQFACDQARFPAYVLSFVAVDPSASRRGLGALMYAALLDALPRDIPVFAFAEAGSIGERLLLNSFARASFRHHPLRECRAVGYLPRLGKPVAVTATALETASYEEFSSGGLLPDDPNVAWTDVTREYWHHYREDPRKRAMVTVQDAAGDPLGAAMFVSAESISAQGLVKVPMLESVMLRKPTAEALAALLGFAARESLPGSTVVVSNLSHLDAGIIKAAGARSLPSLFNAHAFVRGQTHTVETSAALNLEVI